jgi:4-diphosphocytidyl-2-C-methyl-D-erythritol kinase
LGSDVPFFLHRGAAICRGRGERIEPLKILAGIPVVIAQPPTGLLTSRVFKTVEIPIQPRSVDAMAQSVVAGRPAEIARRMFNRLQGFAMEMNTEIKLLARAFSRTNCLGHQMTGSGSSYFGIFSSVRVARLAAQSLSNRLPGVRIFCNETISLKSNMQFNRNHPHS